MEQGSQPSVIRCSSCGRFLGYQAITDGELYLFCKNCKGWTAFMAGREIGLLSPEKLMRTVSEREERNGRRS